MPSIDFDSSSDLVGLCFWFLFRGQICDVLHWWLEIENCLINTKMYNPIKIETSLEVSIEHLNQDIKFLPWRNHSSTNCLQRQTGNGVSIQATVSVQKGSKCQSIANLSAIRWGAKSQSSRGEASDEFKDFFAQQQIHNFPYRHCVGYWGLLDIWLWLERLQVPPTILLFETC